jgi:hemolysin activation/secretion protein
MMICKPMTKLMFIVFACAVFGILTTETFADRTVVSDPTKTESRLELEEKEKADDAAKDKPEVEAVSSEEADKLAPVEDTSARLSAKEIRISGNTVLTTEELLKNIPAIFNTSGLPIEQAPAGKVYDFKIIKDLLANPGEVREVSTKSIQGFTQYLLSVFQKSNYGGIYIYVPSDTVDSDSNLLDGVLSITILEAKVDSVSVKHLNTSNDVAQYGYLKDSAVYDWSPVSKGNVVNRSKLDDFINLLNLNPDRYVSAVISSGSDPNTISVGYDIYEANPWHSFVQIDNSGTDDQQWTPRLGLINTNLFGYDDIFTMMYQSKWDNTFDEDYAVFGSYDFPIWTPRLRLNLFGGYSQFDVSPETGDVDFLGNGNFYGVNLRLNVFQSNDWFYDVIGTWTHERSKQTPSLFPQFLGTDLKVDLWGWGAHIHHTDDMSNTSFRFDRLSSYDGSTKEEFSIARTGAEPDFTLYVTTANHTQYLDEDRVQRTSGSFRWVTSDSRLAPSKMTSFGGMYSVRGYDEYEITADGGILASLQYEFDLVAYDKAQQQPEGTQVDPKDQKQPFLRSLSPLVFMDYGLAVIEEPLPSEQRDQELLSIGCGLLVELGDNFSGAVYYGYPLIETESTRIGKGNLNVGLMMRW